MPSLCLALQDSASPGGQPGQQVCSGSEGLESKGTWRRNSPTQELPGSSGSMDCALPISRVYTEATGHRKSH